MGLDVRRLGQRGFTLVEILVALTIGAIIVLFAHELFGAVADRGRTLTVARAALDRSANARRWLDATFLSLDVGPARGVSRSCRLVLRRMPPSATSTLSTSAEAPGAAPRSRIHPPS